MKACSYTYKVDAEEELAKDTNDISIVVFGLPAIVAGHDFSSISLSHVSDVNELTNPSGREQL